MTKEQIIRSISDEFKISELESIQFYENVFQYIEGSFRKSKNLNISDFGKFNIIEKTGTDGGRINSVKFSPSKKLATEVNYNYNNLAKILFRDIERNINRDRILSLGEENIYREEAPAETGEVFDRYSEEEKDFIEEQVNLTSSNNKNADLSDLEIRVRKIEAFINVIKKFFEDEKLGDTISKAKTEIVPPQADYVKRVEEDKLKDAEYKASISALEAKIKELEAKFKESESKAPEAKTSVTTVTETRVELPPIDVVPPVIEEKKKEVEAKLPAVPVTEEKTAASDLGNLVVETEYSETVSEAEELQKPEFVSVDEVITDKIAPVEDFKFPAEDFTKPVEESLEAPDIERKIEERLAEIVKEPVKKAPRVKDPSTSNIDDLLRTLGTSIEEEDVIEEQAEEQIIEERAAEDIQEPKIEEVTNEFFIKTDTHTEQIEEKLHEIEEEIVSPVVEEKKPEVIEEKLPEVIEEKKLPDTPLVNEITDTELHKKVDSLIEEFRTESSKIKEEEEKEQQQIIEEQKAAEPEVVKVVPPEDMEEAQLSTALSSIFNSILSSENIKKEEVKETPIIKEEVQNLHNEIVKTEKHEEKIEPPVEEKKDLSQSSISDIYSSAKSFSDIFEHKSESKEDKEHADDMKQIEAMHEKEKNDTNGHGLIESNGHNLVESNGHGLKEVSESSLNESYGPGLTESGREHDVRTSKIYTNGNPLKPYPPSNGKNGNGASTLNQVLEDNGLHKESKTSILIIIIIIVIALGLLFFAIFNSGIMGKENLTRKENNYGLVKVKDAKNEKYFYDNGKDKVYFETEKGFTIQAGSFNDKESAIQKSKQLSDKKIDNVRIEELEKDNSTFFRVRIGMFATLEEAKNYSEKF